MPWRNTPCAWHPSRKQCNCRGLLPDPMAYSVWSPWYLPLLCSHTRRLAPERISPTVLDDFGQFGVIFGVKYVTVAEGGWRISSMARSGVVRRPHLEAALDLLEAGSVTLLGLVLNDVPCDAHGRLRGLRGLRRLRRLRGLLHEPGRGQGSR